MRLKSGACGGGCKYSELAVGRPCWREGVRPEKDAGSEDGDYARQPQDFRFFLKAIQYYEKF